MLAGVDGGGTTAAEAIKRLLAAQIELRNGRRLEKAHAAGRLKQRLKTLTHPALLVVDEIGYLSVTPNGASLFFQLVNSRYGCASTVLTSNKGFEHCGEILHDEVMPAALLDRLLHRCHIVNIRDNSYRMRRHMELSKAIHPLAGQIDAESLASGEGPS
ncbi:MAG: ATP-binding protein [Acidobacteriota bacterium]|nr:ATP-binding protein [Acidobacteriota bacterium]